MDEGKVERERDEMIAAYDNCMKLALTYHGQLERTRAALRELIGNEFAYLQLLAAIDAEAGVDHG